MLVNGPGTIFWITLPPASSRTIVRRVSCAASAFACFQLTVIPGVGKNSPFGAFPSACRSTGRAGTNVLTGSETLVGPQPRVALRDSGPQARVMTK